MQREHAEKAIEFVFASPSPDLKIEFQGGEPLLNFELIRWIVERVSKRNATEERDISFVIATNLAILTEEVLEFCAEYEINISTSLDGPRELHNANRPRIGHSDKSGVDGAFGRAACVAAVHKARSAVTELFELGQLRLPYS